MAAWSKQTYEMTAEVLRGAVAERPNNLDWCRAIEQVAYRLADVFEEDNKRFDRNRFLKAAGSDL